jgi:hypothetical protein
MRKCDVCSDTFDKSFLALSLMFGDSGLICHHLRGGRNQWDDSFKAAAKLGRICDVEEKKGLEFLRKSLTAMKCDIKMTRPIESRGSSQDISLDI